MFMLLDPEPKKLSKYQILQRVLQMVICTWDIGQVWAGCMGFINMNIAHMGEEDSFPMS